MKAIPLSLHALALLAAAQRASKKENIVQGALDILEDDTASVTTLSAEFSRLVDLKLLEREDSVFYKLTERAVETMKDNALRVYRVYARITY